MSDGMTAPPNKQLVRAYVGANGESHQGVTGVTSGKLREAEQKLDEPAIKPEAIEQHEPAVLPLSTVDSAGTVPEPSDIVDVLFDECRFQFEWQAVFSESSCRGFDFSI